MSCQLGDRFARGTARTTVGVMVGLLLATLATAQELDQTPGQCLALKDIEYGVGDESLELCRRGCLEGSMRSCALLGYVHNLAGNVEEAEDRLGQSCDGGDLFGCLLLVTGKKRDPRDAYAADCNAGAPSACLGLGRVEYESGNLARAEYLTAIACDAGLAEGCGLLGPRFRRDG